MRWCRDLPFIEWYSRITLLFGYISYYECITVAIITACYIPAAALHKYIRCPSSCCRAGFVSCDLCASLLMWLRWQCDYTAPDGRSLTATHAAASPVNSDDCASIITNPGLLYNSYQYIGVERGALGRDWKQTEITDDANRCFIRCYEPVNSPAFNLL